MGKKKTKNNNKAIKSFSDLGSLVRFPDKLSDHKAKTTKISHPRERQKDTPFQQTDNKKQNNGHRPQTNNTYPLPEGLLELSENVNSEISNLSLLFNRFIPYSRHEKEDGNTIWKIDNKPQLWKMIEKEANDLAQNCRNAHYGVERQKMLLNSLRAKYGKDQVVEIIAQTVSKLSIGFGTPSPLETGLSLHKLYNLPYIPATSVKGICRSWVEFDIQGDCNESMDYIQIFGSKDAEGDICFYDAFPTAKNLNKPSAKSLSEPLFSNDIINVHFQPYYDKKQPPADYLSPIPNNFLTVSPGIDFRFIIHTRSKGNNDLIQTAANWLSKALTEAGIGSKTAVGYGEMKILNIN